MFLQKDIVRSLSCKINMYFTELITQTFGIWKLNKSEEISLPKFNQSGHHLKCPRISLNVSWFKIYFSFGDGFKKTATFEFLKKIPYHKKTPRLIWMIHSCFHSFIGEWYDHKVHSWISMLYNASPDQPSIPSFFSKSENFNTLRAQYFGNYLASVINTVIVKEDIFIK